MVGHNQEGEWQDPDFYGNFIFEQKFQFILTKIKL